jgi:hypothetical protein
LSASQLQSVSTTRAIAEDDGTVGSIALLVAPDRAGSRLDLWTNHTRKWLVEFATYCGPNPG